MKPNNYFLITGILLLLLVGFGIALSLGVRRLPDVGQTLQDKEVWVYTDHPVTQSFTPIHDGLNVVTIYLRNVALRNQLPFTFTLSNSSGQILRTINLTGYNIGDGENIRFQFDPIGRSAGEQFTFTLSADSPQSIAIGAGFSSSTGHLTYQTYYCPTSRLQTISASVAGFIRSVSRPRFLLLVAVFGLAGYFLISSKDI